MRPRKRFGQHFLEPAWVRKVVDLIDPQPDQQMVEVGPGRGALTMPLAARAERLLVIEVDRDLAARLTANASDNVQVITGDVLKIDLPAEIGGWAGAKPVRIVGNLPYNISCSTSRRARVRCSTPT